MSVTAPVGAGLPDAPVTVTVTVSLWAVVMFVAPGTTVTVGVDVVAVRNAVPESVNVWVVPLAFSALSVRVSVPVNAPVLFGVKSTPSVQLPFTANGDETEHVVALASRLKFVLERATPVIVSG